MSSETTTFLIVTPSFNSAEFIDETIHSVVSQRGPFRIRYHVQDGGSKDATITKLEAWKATLTTGGFPILCSGVDFTFSSEPDRGMYDAINRGFQYLGVQDEDYLTYINSDDRILPGAFEFASGRFAESPEMHWLGGRPCEMNARGEMMRIHEGQVYPTASLRAGLHDGRFMCFVMQEGTFWRGSLWKKAGSFRSDLRQAGDWDLWRRFSHHADYFTTDMVLACHRRSPDQLTTEMSTYYREVDAVVDREIGELHSAELGKFGQWRAASDQASDQRFYGNILRFKVAHGGQGSWEIRHLPYQPLVQPTVSVTNGFTSVMLSAQFGSGFGSERTADQMLSLLPGYRPTTSSECQLRFGANREALHRIFMRCRSFEPGICIKLVHKTRTILNVELPMTRHDRDCLLIAEAGFHQGSNELSLLIVGRNPENAPTLLIISCEAMSTV